jgi:Retinol binding protein receptor
VIRQAFFYPTRLVTTFVISVLATVTLFALTVNAFQNMRQGVYTMDSTAIRTVFTGVNSMESLFYNTRYQELFDSEVEWAYDQAYTLHHEFTRLSDALYYSFIIGATISLVAYTGAWMVLLADFRVQSLEGRRGAWRFDSKQIRYADASNFIGLQVSNSLLTYLLVLVLSVIVSMVFTWPLIILTILDYWRTILILVLPSIIQSLVVRRIIGYELLTSASGPMGDRIAHRRLYMLYDVVQAYLTMFTGIVTAIVRMVTVLGVTILSMPRLDQTPMPAWLGRYLLLDTATRSYRGVLVQHHAFNHPIAVVFLHVLSDAVASRRQEAKAVEQGRRDKLKRVSRKFHMLWLLHKMPQMAKYRRRAGGLATSGVDGIADGVVVNPMYGTPVASRHTTPQP